MLKLKVYYQNCRSIRGKLKNLYLQSLLCNYDVIVFTETWLNESVMSGEVLDDRFIVYRRDRCLKSAGKLDGGGVLIGVRKYLNSYRRPKLESVSEDLWVTIPYSGKNLSKTLNLCAVYIPSPCTPQKMEIQMDNLSNALNILDNDGIQETLIMGDFNLSCIVWTSTKCGKLVPSELSPQNYCCTLLYDFLALHNINQFNLVYNKDNNILDLVLCSIDSIKVSGIEHMSKIDTYHPPLLIELDLVSMSSVLTKLEVPRYNFRSANYTALNADLNAVNWNSVIGNEQDVNIMVDKFYTTLNNLIDIHVPKKRPKNNRYPVWFSYDLIKRIKEKDKLHTKYKRYKNPLDYCDYSYVREFCHKTIQTCYQQYLKSIEDNICSNNIKAFWSFLKNKRKSTELIPSTMYLDGHKLSVPQAICDGFAKHFSSVYVSNSNTTLDTTLLPNSPCDYLSTIDITPLSIKRAICKLDVNQGPGPDGIPAVLIKRCANDLVFPLYLIFRRSIDSGIFPNKWKLANVIPIPKGADAADIQDYRPISLLSLMEKIFESVVSPNFSHLLSTVVNCNQHGFLKHKSTNTNLACYVAELQESIDRGLQVDAIYTDISKAFDRVDHMILLHKLAGIGVHGNLLRWFESYLTGRSQKVVVAGLESLPFVASSGVPQGSNLGPKLFLVFVNDLPDVIRNSHYSLFADDLKIYRTINDSHDASLLQEDLSNILEWTIMNNLPLNIKKCKFISFTKKHVPISASYNLDGTSLEEVSEMRDLGVILDKHLTFNKHIDKIVKKSFAMLGFVWRNCKDFRNVSALKMAYCALVRSNLEYCSSIWSPHYQCHIDRIEKVQKRFLYYLSGHQGRRRSLANYTNRLHYFELTSLENRRFNADQIFLYKIFNNKIMCPQLLSKFNLVIPRRGSRVVNYRPFYLRSARTNVGQFSIINRISRQHNQLFAKNPHRFDLFACTLSKFKSNLNKL